MTKVIELAASLLVLRTREYCASCDDKASTFGN